MKKTDRKVLEYLERAKNIIGDIDIQLNYLLSKEGGLDIDYAFRSIIVVAKMIQIEERREVLDGSKRTKKNSR